MEIDVAEPSVGLELAVVADVLGEEQLRRVSPLEQLHDDLHQPRLERLLDPEPMAEEVELEVGAGINTAR